MALSMMAMEANEKCGGGGGGSPRRGGGDEGCGP